ncbi:ABC transporter ATP-binding protein [Marinobacterium mangrovicola]|uniref:Peptide/nickel transport system ATP-binding protein n=1 Tax=Marinobacterium mangrovicola TaxID=1476959 RepID=A0A4R1GE16_9GAMM|nr:ABC transporter ATP-binding protein [Marinobacterium mangrovicola]TCK04885.1 peptide/nickel transport system ATP-binding protein [Marinobacterium mangrovicola]
MQVIKPLLAIRDLAVEFNLHGTPVPAVKGISLTLWPGRTLALVGESGSGKTVTSQAILGILPANASITQGEILFTPPEGETVDIAQLSPNSPAMREIRGDKISIIFQEPMVSLSPMHTIGNQITEAIRLHRDIPKAEEKQLTIEMLTLAGFPKPEQAFNAYPFELSGGLRQRAMIAMALICHPALLIADEPTTALDVTVQAQILHLIKSLQQKLGMAVLLITHDLGVVANMADDLVVMYHGEVMESGPSEALFRNPQHPYLQALFAAVPHFDMKPGERLRPIREIAHETSAFKHGLGAKTEAQRQAAPHLSITNLDKSFGSRKGSLLGGEQSTTRAVFDLSLDIAVGESFGLVGESGCGKTTLSKLLMGALKPDAGSILYNAHGEQIDLGSLQGEELRQFRRRIGLVFQDPHGALNPRMTIMNILREPLVIHKFGNEQSQRQRAKDLLALVGLSPRFLNRYPHSLSGGQRQRVSIARALALEPELLILDEPVSALDVSVQAQVLNLLKDLQQELGMTYLFVSHNIAVVDYIADRIGVMCRGRLVEVGRREQILRNPTHPYTRALMAAIPYPDLDRPLDFQRIIGSNYSDPASWDSPYAHGPEQHTEWQQVAENHLVRIAAGPALSNETGEMGEKNAPEARL